MKRKLKISAESREALRTFLVGADVDLGCRPMAHREVGRVTIIAAAEEAEITRLSAPRADSVSVEALDPVPSAGARRAMVAGGNRFLAGERPQGFGEKK